MNVLANYQWEHGMKEEVAKITAEAIVYGTAISKDGVRINYEDLTH